VWNPEVKIFDFLGVCCVTREFRTVMAELGRSDADGNDMIENLIAARKSLKLNLEKSKALGFSLEKAGPRLDEINQRLPSLEAAVPPIRADKEALIAAGGHINHAIGPAVLIERFIK